MKALTILQPWASLIAHGVKTIETRPRRITHRGPVAIHAGQDMREFWRIWNAGHRTTGQEAEITEALWKLDVDPMLGDDMLPRGAIVATANLVDCVPVLADGDENHDGMFARLERDGLWIYNYGSGRCADVSRQLPFGDFRPGCYAWLLDDIKPTTERCPWCWGVGRVDHPVPGVPRAVCQASTPCPVCWPRKPDGERKAWDHDGERGRCDPIPARGQQVTPWEWSP